MEDTVANLRAQMATADYGRDDPIRTTMALIGDSWTPLILLVLDSGEWRHADLRRALDQLSGERPISQRVLTLKLRALEREGYVTRHATPDVPPRVSYALSPLGQDLQRLVRTQVQWIAERRGAIAAARAQYDATR